MIDEIREFWLFVLGTYEPRTFTEYILDPQTNQLVPYDVIPDGVGAWDLEYIFAFITMLLVIYALYKAYSFLAYLFFGKKKRKIM